METNLKRTSAILCFYDILYFRSFHLAKIESCETQKKYENMLMNDEQHDMLLSWAFDVLSETQTATAPTEIICDKFEYC